jgi:alpha-tubulin suppressor-like RCC1 family protein
LVSIGQGRSVKAMTTGASHTCVVLDTNQVKCWGPNDSGELGQGDVLARGDQPNEMGQQLPIVQLGSRVTTIATVGTQFACARLGNGQLKCWGTNGVGQLGLGDTANRGSTPASMGNGLPAVALGTNRTIYSGLGSVISAASTHVCAVLDNKQVKCWGSGANGKLGLGDTTNRGDGPDEMGDNLPPVNLGTGKLALQVSTGQFHSCARLSTGEVKCWGDNSVGALGLGDTVTRGDGLNEMGDNLPPVNLGTGKTALQVAVGRSFTCALLNTNEVKCWGSTFALPYGAGNVGDGANEMGDFLPVVPLGTGLTAKAISAGTSHACAWLSNNQVKCWGSGSNAVLGQGDTSDRRTPAVMGDALLPVNLGTGRTAKGIYASLFATCALLDTNQVKCWGTDLDGVLGSGTFTIRGDEPADMGDFMPPVFLGTGRTVTALMAGSMARSLCALLDTRQIKCWGPNDMGELGIGTVDSRGDAPGELGDALPAVDLGPEL